jgi:hypothetical protein
MPTETHVVSAIFEQADTEECANFLLALKDQPSPPTVPKTTNDEKTKTTITTEMTGSSMNCPESDDSYKAPSLQEEHHSYLSSPSASLATVTNTDIESLLLGDSDLVYMEDRLLVPDSIFFAMAQMKVCYLRESDKVGSYKNRDIGFAGICCKHCGQRRTFPSTIRCLSQTTTSQTIVKHAASKCRYIPEELSQKITNLMLQEAMETDADNFVSKRRYGSRKVFFKRIWDRLHNSDNNTLEPYDGPLSGDESLTNSEDGASPSPPSQKRQRFGVLPTAQSRKRQKSS